ncbi:GDNF family receptor alpha-like [Labrus bergylta]|uniref:GDNF family receptor alpha-like n=1 Tax=Labrus bergylta TaxID=56723 RepID=UPI003313DF99
MKLEAAVILAIVFPQIFSLSVSPPPPDCSAAVHTCMSDLCKKETAFYGGTCADETCQIKGSQACNMTIQAVLVQFPSLEGCVCAREEEELCGSIRELATQCRPNTASQQKRSSGMDWQSSTLIHNAYDAAGSCLDRMTECVSDAVCNRYLAPVLQACTAEQCDSDRCQQVTQQFYSSMPCSVAEMLVLCECAASDQNCLHMKSTLHSGTCGVSTLICQETTDQCAEDQDCRKLLKTLREKCWSSEGAQCSDSDLENNECFSRMDPALILGADPECQRAFLATMGTVLHYPCTCRGMHGDDLLTCNMIYEVFHNRSLFITSWKKSTSKPPGLSDPEDGYVWSNDYLLYAFATLLLVGVVILMTLAVISKIWMLRRREKTKFHHPQKSPCVVIL